MTEKKSKVFEQRKGYDSIFLAGMSVEAFVKRRTKAEADVLLAAMELTVTSYRRFLEIFGECSGEVVDRVIAIAEENFDDFDHIKENMEVFANLAEMVRYNFSFD